MRTRNDDTPIDAPKINPLNNIIIYTSVLYTQATDLAFVWSLSRVCPHVPVQLARVFKGAVTYGALVGTFFGVDSAVHVQIFLHAECLVTELTSEKVKRDI